MTQITKARWIQKAKALLYDMSMAVDAEGLVQEAKALIEEGGGYDPQVESAKTPLRWNEKDGKPV